MQGDTTSVVGLALAAMHRKIKVIHLEAGLRSRDTGNPFPEEYNRKIVSSIASVHLCPTESNKNNLLKEGVQSNVYVVGNTVLDNLLPYKDECEYDNKVLITMHRRENLDNLSTWFAEINNIASKNKNLEFILPLHPNPAIQAHKHLLPDVNIAAPMSHDDLIKLLIKCRIVITDSGGLQEECSFSIRSVWYVEARRNARKLLELAAFLCADPSVCKIFLINI